VGPRRAAGQVASFKGERNRNQGQSRSSAAATIPLERASRGARRCRRD
jgi:hypothetical protein